VLREAEQEYPVCRAIAENVSMRVELEPFEPGLALDEHRSVDELD